MFLKYNLVENERSEKEKHEVDRERQMGNYRIQILSKRDDETKVRIINWGKGNKTKSKN